MSTVLLPEKPIPIRGTYDVVVAGGGPGGIPAAIAAARQGARVLLVERYGFLGGLATAGLVAPILAHTAHESDQPIVEGILREMTERMCDIGGAPAWRDACSEWGIRFDAESFKYVADRLALDSGVAILFHSLVTGVVTDDRRVTHLVIESKSGREAVAAKAFVDATGDADVAYRCSASTVQGRGFDGRVESMGSFIHLGGIDAVTVDEAAAAQKRLEREMEAGRIRFYGSAIQSRLSMQPDHYALNRTRFAADPTNVNDLTAAEIEFREQAHRFVRFLREQPGFENVYLRATSPHGGPRESRRIVGDYILTGDDICSGRKHSDAVARGSWWIDIHCPLGNTYPVHLCVLECPKREECAFWVAEHETGMRPRDSLSPPKGDWYDIPYRSLVPEGVENLLVSGRCISASHEGMAGARVMGTCMAIGEAAGVAAALAADGNVACRDVGVDELRRRLSAAGALV